MTQFIGKATIKVGGNTLNTLPGAKLNLGGFTREPVVGSTKVLGYSEKVEPSMIDCSVALAKGQSLKGLDFSDATVTFLADTGQVWSLANAFLSSPLEVTAQDGGSIALKIVAERCEEVSAA